MHDPGPRLVKVSVASLARKKKSVSTKSPTLKSGGSKAGSASRKSGGSVAASGSAGDSGSQSQVIATSAANNRKRSRALFSSGTDSAAPVEDGAQKSTKTAAGESMNAAGALGILALAGLEIEGSVPSKNGQKNTAAAVAAVDGKSLATESRRHGGQTAAGGQRPGMQRVRDKARRRPISAAVLRQQVAAGGSHSEAAPDSPTSASMQQSLQKCLGESRHSVVKWAVYEWLYAPVDTPFFARREFEELLPTVGLNGVTHLTRTEWSQVRATMGKARRLSAAFLEEERRKLEEHRALTRMRHRTNKEMGS